MSWLRERRRRKILTVVTVVLVFLVFLVLFLNAMNVFKVYARVRVLGAVAYPYLQGYMLVLNLSATGNCTLVNIVSGSGTYSVAYPVSPPSTLLRIYVPRDPGDHVNLLFDGAPPVNNVRVEKPSLPLEFAVSPSPDGLWVFLRSTGKYYLYASKHDKVCLVYNDLVYRSKPAYPFTPDAVLEASNTSLSFLEENCPAVLFVDVLPEQRVLEKMRGLIAVSWVRAKPFSYKLVYENNTGKIEPAGPEDWWGYTCIHEGYNRAEPSKDWLRGLYEYVDAKHYVLPLDICTRNIGESFYSSDVSPIVFTTTRNGRLLVDLSGTPQLAYYLLRFHLAKPVLVEGESYSGLVGVGVKPPAYVLLRTGKGFRERVVEPGFKYTVREGKAFIYLGGALNGSHLVRITRADKGGNVLGTVYVNRTVLPATVQVRFRNNETLLVYVDDKLYGIVAVSERVPKVRVTYNDLYEFFGLTVYASDYDEPPLLYLNGRFYGRINDSITITSPPGKYLYIEVWSDDGRLVYSKLITLHHLWEKGEFIFFLGVTALTLLMSLGLFRPRPRKLVYLALPEKEEYEPGAVGEEEVYRVLEVLSSSLKTPPLLTQLYDSFVKFYGLDSVGRVSTALLGLLEEGRVSVKSYYLPELQEYYTIVFPHPNPSREEFFKALVAHALMGVGKETGVKVVKTGRQERESIGAPVDILLYTRDKVYYVLVEMEDKVVDAVRRAIQLHRHKRLFKEIFGGVIIVSTSRGYRRASRIIRQLYEGRIPQEIYVSGIERLLEEKVNIIPAPYLRLSPLLSAIFLGEDDAIRDWYLDPSTVDILYAYTRLK